MGSLAALTGITDIRGHMNQCEHLLFHSSLTALCNRYQGLCFTTVWSPPQQLWVMDNTAPFKALAACCLTPRTSLNRVQSAAHSKAVACEHAFTLWARDWEAKRHTTPGPPSWAYENALLHPSNRSNHPLWIAAVATDREPEVGQCVPKFSWYTTFTALHFAIGHAFMSDYMACFQPDLPLDQLACTCGWPTHSFDHLLLNCPRSHEARFMVSQALSYCDANTCHVPWCLTSPHESFTQHVVDFVEYIHLSHIGFKPPSDIVVPFDLE